MDFPQSAHSHVTTTQIKKYNTTGTTQHPSWPTAVSAPPKVTIKTTVRPVSYSLRSEEIPLDALCIFEPHISLY